jgi:hypothetical protein
MRLWLVLVLGVQVLFPAAAYAAPWVKFADPSGQFSLMFPTAPEMKPASRTPAFVSGEKTFPLHAYGTKVGGDKGFLMVFDVDLNGVDVDAQKVLDDQQSHLLQSGTNGTVKAVTLDGVACRDLSIATQGGGHSTTTMFFLRSHLYQVVAIMFAAASAQDIEDARRFSDSLHFNR